MQPLASSYTESPWSVRLRVALDVLGQLSRARAGTVGSRSAASGLHLARVDVGEDGVVAPLDPGDGTGVDVLLWEILAARSAEAGDLSALPRLHDTLDEAPPDVDDLIESLRGTDRRPAIDELFDAFFTAAGHLPAPHSEVRRRLFGGASEPPPPVTVRPADISSRSSGGHEATLYRPSPYAAPPPGAPSEAPQPPAPGTPPAPTPPGGGAKPSTGILGASTAEFDALLKKLRPSSPPPHAGPSVDGARPARERGWGVASADRGTDGAAGGEGAGPDVRRGARGMSGSFRMVPAAASAASPVDVADALLIASSSSDVVTLEPGADGYAIGLSRGEGGIALVQEVGGLPFAVGQAVVARLFIVAGIDLAGPHEQVGRIQLRVADAPRAPGSVSGACELYVIGRAGPNGPGVELKRLARAPTPVIAPPSSSPHRALSYGTGYEVLRELGRGGMGVVYLAEHRVLGKHVALKVLHPELAAVPEVAARFVAEGRAAARARHPGIVDVYDFGALPDGRSYLVMELVEGETVEEMLLKSGPFPVARALSVVRRVALALHAVHLCDVVHRDIKPSNVFVGQDDTVKVGDFGIAKTVRSSTNTPKHTALGSIVGTPLYMSPEAIHGDVVTGQTDVYALGCMLFEMVAGKVPFDAESPVGIMTLQLTAPIPEPTSPFGPVPPRAVEIIRRAMAKSRGDRYATARAMAEDIAAAEAELA